MRFSLVRIPILQAEKFSSHAQAFEVRRHPPGIAEPQLGIEELGVSREAAKKEMGGKFFTTP